MRAAGRNFWPPCGPWGSAACEQNLPRRPFASAGGGGASIFACLPPGRRLCVPASLDRNPGPHAASAHRQDQPRRVQPGRHCVTAEPSAESEGKPALSLPTVLAVLGVVYGDIGTSPLYAFKASLQFFSDLPITNTEILGVLSLLFWSLILVVTLKYVTLIMRADNRGEGGILALM